MTVMSDGCQPVEAAAEGDDAEPGHAAPSGHDFPTGTNMGAPAFACKVFMDASLFHKALSWPLLDVSRRYCERFLHTKGPYKLYILIKCQ